MCDWISDILQPVPIGLLQIRWRRPVTTGVLRRERGFLRRGRVRPARRASAAALLPRGRLAAAAAARLRAEALEKFLDGWEKKHATLTPAELSQAERELGLEVPKKSRP